MRGRAAAGSAVVVLAIFAVGFLLDRAGARNPAEAAPPDAPSGAWFCPHGGGRTGWHVWLSLTNPGSSAVQARVTTFGASKPGTPKDVTVPAKGRVQVPVPSSGRERASMVEYFGGWIAAGWLARAGGDESGMAAEACVPRAGRTWFLPDGTTEKGKDA
jgi:hypothetical protein